MSKRTKFKIYLDEMEAARVKEVKSLINAQTNEQLFSYAITVLNRELKAKAKGLSMCACRIDEAGRIAEYTVYNLPTLQTPEESKEKPKEEEPTKKKKKKRRMEEEPIVKKKKKKKHIGEEPAKKKKKKKRHVEEEPVKKKKKKKRRK